MTFQRLSDRSSPIGSVLDAADDEGAILLEPQGSRSYALVPLDDDLLDCLLEHNPRLIKESARIARRMKRGTFFTHQVKRMFKG